MAELPLVEIKSKAGQLDEVSIDGVKIDGVVGVEVRTAAKASTVSLVIYANVKTIEE
jgi:hypothetical protein